MYTVTRETFDSLTSLKQSVPSLKWNSPFVLPAWMEVWWRQFGKDYEPYLAAVRDRSGVIGIAPLKIKAGTASIVGSDNVCDYLDFIARPGREEELCNTILDDLKRLDIRRLDMGLLRANSIVLTKLAGVSRSRGAEVTTTQEDVSSEMDLPVTFEDYLLMLNTKQRHEVRRKLRRLKEAGEVRYVLLNGGDNLDSTLDRFMHLFSLARDEKARFMTADMEAFFRSLASAMAGDGALRVGELDFDGRTVAMVMCFDYNDSVYLYNSGFDPQYDSLSVGLLSKIFCIEQSIQQGKKRFEFLKGNEIYKQRLGGKEIPLYRCQITIA